MARITGEWLQGPSPELGRGRTQRYRGERLGCPESGPGSLALSGRRLAALAIDWFMAMGITALVTGQAYGPDAGLITMGVFTLIGVAGVMLFAATPGQMIIGLQVGRTDGRPRVSLVPALVRSVLLLLVIPAVITDIDGRGLHDRLSKTAVVRSR